MLDSQLCNETNYELAPWILRCIRSEVAEYFGDEVRVIRVQVGINRHAFNTKTREVRYAFYPEDYELSRPAVPAVEVDIDMAQTRDDSNPFVLAELDDDPDEADVALTMIDEDFDAFDSGPDAELQELDPDFDAIDTADLVFPNDNYATFEQEEDE